MTRLEIRMSGRGGQGVITSAFVLGQACLFDRKNVAQTQSYGPEARGGTSCSEIVIADEEIDYPWVVQPDILVALSQDAYNMYRNDVKTTGLIIVDPDLVELTMLEHTITIYKVQVTETAKTVFGNPIFANVIMLGALIAITNIISPEAVIKSIIKQWPKYARLNIKAYQKGMELGSAAQTTVKPMKA